MTRITKTIREQMAAKLVQHKVIEEGKALATANRTLFERVYDEAYCAKTKAAMAALMAIHKDAFDAANSITVNVGGMRFDVGGHTPCHSRHVRIQQAVIEGRPYIKRVASLYNPYVPKNQKLIDDLHQFALDRQKFAEDVDVSYREALSALETFTTGKKLAEGWPEAMEVIGDLIPEDCRTLPTVQVKELNHKFGLPPKTKKAA